ncbi:MAG: bifunctional (p)ppGpp synthetase/guanosine-3',5'-bis(diphosphate) 3'-pyrophosphohydrolase [Bacillota bacterium]|nr:bifunctional (p)ppGpp synthetase/guanosine-3',5'-bis(diphosphate) 3'-pyrophosphohydrolase [Bacillota bacterium]
MAVKEKKLIDLKKKFERYYPDLKDWELVEKAYNFSLQAHSGQLRESGESYIMHPLGVAIILSELELDLVTIVAGLLHDVVEDTPVTLEEILEEFGTEVAELVDGVTKLGRLDFTSKEEQQAETLRKMFIAMARDIRVVLIKLADRTHNLRTLRYLNTHKQKEIAKETLEIYAPLAHRLGIYKIKWELEDLAFRYMQPTEYFQLVEKLAKKRQEREHFINRIIWILQDQLSEASIEAEIQGRPKHFYSIYNKMKTQGKELSEIYDLTAVRIIVNSVKDCYHTLGIVHTIWKPIPGRFKDFIAMPKPNMYQSLHTTVFAAENELAEIQIRTWDMHRTAEYGIAAHWRYKEKVKDSGELDEKLTWLRQLLEWQHDYRDARDFIKDLKGDLFTDEVFVFTPKGDVIDLPAGSITLDFAYKIHTDIGNHCTGARVNGRLVPLDYQLKTGDMVEVLTSKHGSPSRDWLKLIKTPHAKNKIRNWFKKERREENIEKGREMLEREIRRINVEQHLLLKNDLLEEVGRSFNLLSAEDLYAAVGYGGVSVNQVLSRLREEYNRRNEDKDQEKSLPELKPVKHLKQPLAGVTIQGVDNLLVRVARCCNPVPGDDIIGFITRGRGVSVHRRDCPNLRYHRNESERFLEASWEAETEASYPVEIEIIASDRKNLLADIMADVNESKVDITAVMARADKNNLATIHMTMVVRDQPHLDQIMAKIKKVKDVYSVQRYVYGANNTGKK